MIDGRVEDLIEGHAAVRGLVAVAGVAAARGRRRRRSGRFPTGGATAGARGESRCDRAAVALRQPPRIADELKVDVRIAGDFPGAEATGIRLTVDRLVLDVGFREEFPDRDVEI